MAAPEDGPDRAATLQRLAETLGLPVSYFLEPDAGADAEAARPALVDMLRDAQGARIARAFLDVEGDGNRRALADTVVAIVGTMSLKAARRR